MKWAFVRRDEYLFVCVERDALKLENKVLKRELDRMSKVDAADELMRKTLHDDVQRLEKQCSELKRKYANEVQKRYDLTLRCEELETENAKLTLRGACNEHI